jgi:hypothetical protein
MLYKYGDSKVRNLVVETGEEKSSKLLDLKMQQYFLTIIRPSLTALLRIQATPLSSGSFDRSLLKEEAQRYFRKIRPSPIMGKPFKDFAPSNTVIGH